MSYPGTKGQKGPSDSVKILGEISGSVGNFGTVLPILLGAALVSEVDLGAALLFTGIWYIVMGIYYGIPISVEPMKAIGAIAIAGELTCGEIAASGLILGAALLVLGAGKGIGRLQGLIPEGVVRGVQLGLALILIKTSAGLMIQDPIFSSVAIGVFLIFLLAKSWRSLPDVSILVVFAIGVGYGLITRGVPDIQPISMGILPLPDPATFIWAGWHLVLPQIPLTLTNASVAAALTAEDLYKRRIEPDRLCITMGVMNLASVPFGGFPLCHGSGGIAAHHRFGARTRISMAIGGSVLIIIALFFAAPESLSLLPIGLFGALLLFVGLELGRCGLRTDQPLLVSAIALLVLFTNPAAAFAAGFLLALARDRWAVKIGRGG
jgi:MFS superfamily sulfate permease-like transporter